MASVGRIRSVHITTINIDIVLRPSPPSLPTRPRAKCRRFAVSVYFDSMYFVWGVDLSGMNGHDNDTSLPHYDLC